MCSTLLPCLRRLDQTLSYELSSPGCRQLDHRLQEEITQHRGGKRNLVQGENQR